MSAPILTWGGPRSLSAVRSRHHEMAAALGVTPAVNGRVYWAMHTCWWTASQRDLYKLPDEGLPCDPRGSMLMEGELETFLEKAGEDWSHYGPYGVVAFLAAHHGNVEAWAKGEGIISRLDRLLPTSLEGWPAYTALLDGWREKLGKKIERAEQLLDQVPRNLPEWFRLAHARSEWALGNLLVCAGDLERLAVLGSEVDPWSTS